MRKRCLFLCVSLAMLLPSIRSIAQTVETANLETKVIDLLRSKVKEGDPGVAVAVIKDGKLAARAVAGNANLDYAIPITDRTSFNIASNAKQFTAACVLLLEKEKLISLDDDFRKYIPDVLKNNPEKITIRNLVNHTSGVRDVYDLWALQGKTWWQTFVGNGDAINLLKGQTDLNFKPGTKYLYSNSNYILLAEIVKAVTKKSLKDFAKERIFLPLQMTATQFADNYMDAVEKRADGYGNFSGWKKYPWITNTYGDGALFTTLDDQIKWELHLQNPKIWDASFNTSFLAPLRTGEFGSYGHGLMFGEYKGLPHAYHDGSTGAYNAAFDRFPSESLSVIVMSNNGNIGTRSLSLELAQLVLAKDKIKELALQLDDMGDAAEQIDIVGDYAFDDGTLIQIRSVGGVVSREIYGREPSKLRRIGRSLFVYEGNESLNMKFDLDGGKAKALTILAPAQYPQRAVRLAAAIIDSSSLAGISGRFINGETDTFIELSFKKDWEFDLNKNGRTRTAKLQRPDYLRMNSYQILIDRDEKGKVTGLTVNNDRVTNVKFKKVS